LHFVKILQKIRFPFNHDAFLPFFVRKYSKIFNMKILKNRSEFISGKIL